ncbi:MAG: hypothetical protein WC309_01235 [Candidatus Paceibacterota bacterium]|jgi:hypothetical protein
MSITKPYFRIFRPNKNSFKYDASYTIDNRNILDWSSPIMAFDLITEDFKTICKYIDPCDENSCVHSHRLYELFIRTCTEIESNMKAILKVNGYKKTDKNGKTIDDNKWNIEDYKLLEPILKLSDYKVSINFWNGGRGGEYGPFNNLANGKTNKLVWYMDYNQVKHNRAERFNLANLGNVIDSLCGLFVVLFSQYGPQVFSPYQQVTTYDISSDNVISGSDTTILSIKAPEWAENEKYEFDWESLSKQKNPFQTFFN